MAEYNSCRGLLHFWRDGNGIGVNGAKLTLTLECDSCGTTRSDTIHARTGELLHRSYDYPDDYLMHGLPRRQRPTKQDWRREFVRTLRAKA